MNESLRKGLMLSWGLGAVFCFVLLLNLLSTRFAMIDSSRDQGLEVDAYFYTEVGDLKDFLDDDNGKYGKNR